MGKQIRKTNKSEAFNLSDAHIHDVLAQSKITGEPLVICKGEDGALYSDNGQSLWRVVDEKRFNVPNGVAVICDRAFYKCSPLKRVTLPKSLKVIGNAVF
jgi:hypothetical protein